MADNAKKDPKKPIITRVPFSSNDDQEITQLSKLLTGLYNQDHLETHRVINNDDLFKQKVMRVLPSILNDAKELKNLEAKEVHQSFSKKTLAAIAKNPHAYGDALGPALGKSVRAAVKNAFVEFNQNLEKVIESLSSPESLKWRFQAFISRQSYVEFALLKNAQCIVDHMILFDKRNGVALAHASRGKEANPDLVSGMISALETFANDAFSEKGEGSLSEFSVGEQKITIKSCGHLGLATATRGFLTNEYADQLNTLIEFMAMKAPEGRESMNKELETSFTDEMESTIKSWTHSALANNESTKNQKSSKGKNLLKKFTKWIILIAVICGIFSFYKWFTEPTLKEEIENIISQEPSYFHYKITEGKNNSLDLNIFRYSGSPEPAELLDNPIIRNKKGKVKINFTSNIFSRAEEVKSSF